MTGAAADHGGYSFPPLQRRTVLLGLTAAPAAALLAGGALAVVALVVGHGVVALAGALGALAAGVATGFWPVGGEPAARWAPVVAGWLTRRRSALAVDASPDRGHRRVLAAPADTPAQRPPTRSPGGADAAVAGASGSRRHGLGPGSGPRRGRPGTAPPGVHLRQVAPVPGEEAIGALADARTGLLTAVVPLGGPSLALLDPAAQHATVAGWGALLASTARAGSGVRRLQWVHHLRPADTAPLEAVAAAVTGTPPAVAGYRSLVGELGWTTTSECHLVCAVDGRRGGWGIRDGGADEVLRREIRLLRAQLRAGGFDAGPPLDLPALGRLLATAAGPDGTAAGSPWPMARREGWSTLAVDGALTATFWIAEWPQVPVGPDVLAPLLTPGEGRWRAVSLTMAPVAPERAVREAQAARTAGLADDALRARAGFITTARRARDADATARREAELAAGHGELRFSGYVTVGASGPDALEAAASEAVQAASAAGMVLRRLYGRQAEGWAFTLPLGRGVR